MDGGPSDEELLRRSRLDDEAAFAELFDRHADSVFQYAAVRMRSRESGLDVASYVFAEAWRQRHSIDTMDGSLRPWLFGVARNRTARLVATQIRRERLVPAEMVRTSPDHADTVAEQLDAAERFQRVLDAIDRLPAGARDALTMHVWGELSYREIADELGIETGTVKSRINRARQRLAAVLDPSRDGEPTAQVLPLFDPEDQR